ncbi:LPS assembly protein LptD [Desulfococcaceae bacterium OttesenSCG-928-F15]|nr:LPS assembly protein LptD [Desulfococcaceae bacterium OttesenSCG-928-F15]
MRSFFCLAFSLALLFPCLLLAEPAADNEEPYNIYAKRIIYDPGLDAYKAFGDVRIEREDMVFTSDEAMYHPKDGTLAGSGDFVLKQGRDTLMGDRIRYNLNQETGTVENGSLIMADSDFRIRGSVINRTGEDSYTAENVKITTCGGDCPDWSLTASRLSVKHGGYGTLHHGAFRIKDVPVLYTPWLLFPAKTKRQSGLLFPEMDYSDRVGFEYLQPFYFVINDSSDATFYYHFRSQENDRIGVEYRKAWSEESRLLFRAEGLDESEKPEKPKDPDYRGDRYWVRMKGNFDLPANIKGFADIDVVSDKEYFHDFKSGSLGFNTTNLLFQNEFGRDLDPKTEATRTNRFLASKVEDIWNLEAQLLWEDNVEKRRNDLYDNTVQRLPEIRFSTRRQNLQMIPFLYHNFKAETSYFHREDGERGARLDLFPRLYLPFHLGPLSIEPSVGLRQTLWYSDDPEDPGSSGYDRESRTMFDARLDLFTEVHRVFDLDFASVDKIRHSIQPRVTFGYISDEDQENLPYFDNYDRIEKQRLITYSLTQTLTARLPSKKLPGTGQALNQYRELLRFKVSQSYDLDKTSAKDEKAFSDIKSELSTEFFPGFRLYGDIIWSTKEEEWTSYSAGARISRGKHHLYAEHRYSKEIASSLRMSGFIELTERFGVFWDFERNLRDNDTIEEDYGIRYNGGCWQVDLVYSTDEDENKIGLYWTLKGIGTIQHSATAY